MNFVTSPPHPFPSPRCKQRLNLQICSIFSEWPCPPPLRDESWPMTNLMRGRILSQLWYHQSVHCPQLKPVSPNYPISVAIGIFEKQHSMIYENRTPSESCRKVHKEGSGSSFKYSFNSNWELKVSQITFTN